MLRRRFFCFEKGQTSLFLIKGAPRAHTECVKLTTILCCIVLIAFGLGACIFALTGFDVLAALTFGDPYLYRALLSLAGVAALWLTFWLIAFRPTKPLR